MSTAVTSRPSYEPGRIEPLLTFDDVADALGISTRGVRRLVEAGDLPVVRVMRSVRVMPSDLRGYVDRQRDGGG